MSRTVSYLAATALSCLLPGTARAQACPDARTLIGDLSGPLADVRFLADDALEGRAVGTRGARCAADHIASRFRELGLEPAGTGGTWFHSFPIRTGAELGPDNGLEISTRAYDVGKEWTPLGFSASATVEAPLVYGGPGLSRPGQADDRFMRVDLEGRVAVLEWGDPAAGGGVSMRADPHFKATVAAGRRAAGVIILMPEGTPAPDLSAESRAALPVPVAVVDGALAAEVRAAAERGERARLRAEVRPTTTMARNVVARLPGSDPELRGEHVVIGAHYDHLGRGGEGSLDPDSRDVHNGADDNASGTAGVIEIARRLASGPRPARSVLFMAFTGEERGLWGSARWVAEPTVGLGSVVAMINLDMVGRLADDRLTVFGVGTAEEWEDVVRGANRTLAAPLELGLSPDGYGPSDHASFYGAGIPVLHLFTNTHADYHRPSDDWPLVNAPGIERIAALAEEVTRSVAASPARGGVTLTRRTAEPPAHRQASDQAAPSSGYGPYLGTIPDMTPRDSGLRLTGVREGSPAEEAGLRAGDVVVEFDGREIGDIYAYTYALRDRSPGDVVTIVVEREGERITLTATLGERR